MPSSDFSDSDVSIPESIVPFNDFAITPFDDNGPDNNAGEGSSSSRRPNLDLESGNIHESQEALVDNNDKKANRDRHEHPELDRLLVPDDNFSPAGKGDDAIEDDDDDERDGENKYQDKPNGSRANGLRGWQKQRLLGRPRESFDSSDSDEGFHDFSYSRALWQSVKRKFVRARPYLLGLLLAGAVFVFIFFGDLKKSWLPLPAVKYVSISNFFCGRFMERVGLMPNMT